MKQSEEETQKVLINPHAQNTPQKSGLPRLPDNEEAATINQRSDEPTQDPSLKDTNTSSPETASFHGQVKEGNGDLEHTAMDIDISEFARNLSLADKQNAGGMAPKNKSDKGGGPGGDSHAALGAEDTSFQGESLEDARTRTLAAYEPVTQLAPARIIFTEGVLANKEFALSNKITTMGRKHDNIIEIQDDLLSRTHAEIIRAEAGEYTITDKDSHNGTFFKGKKIKSLALHGGEEITIGVNVFRFIMPGAPVSSGEKRLSGPDDASAKALNFFKKNKARPLIAVMGVVVCGLVIVALLRTPANNPATEKNQQAGAKSGAPTADTGETSPGAKAPSPTSADGDSKAREMYQDGLRELKLKNFEDAVKKFDMALSTGSDGQIKSLADEAKALAGRELKVKDTLAAVDVALSGGKANDANALLEAIPPTTIYAQEISSARAKVKDGLVLVALKQAEEMISQKNYPDAQNSLKVVFSLDPQNQEAKRLESLATTRSSAPAPKSETPRKEPSAKWLDLYIKGYFQEAVNKLTASGDKEKADKIIRINELYNAALAFYRGGKLSEAYKNFSFVENLDKELTNGKKSSISVEINKIVAIEYIHRGKAAIEQNDYETGVKELKKASSMDPGNKEIERLMGKLAEAAKTLYEEGYALEPINPQAAVIKWKAVVTITPASDIYNKKALEKIRKYKQ